VLTPKEHDQLPFSDSLLRPCNDRKKAEFLQIARPERDRAYFAALDLAKLTPVRSEARETQPGEVAGAAR
jgi:hypothetical protein